MCARERRHDYLPADLALICAKAYGGVGDDGKEASMETLRRISPSYMDLKGLPPLHVEVGSFETLHDQIVEFVGKASAAQHQRRCPLSPLGGGMTRTAPLGGGMT